MTLSIKTILGCVIALGVLADLFWHDVSLTHEDIMIRAGLLLFSGVLIAPEDFKGLAFWRKE